MLLPDPLRSGDIHFVLVKSLSYKVRLALIVGLLLAGFAVQAVANLYVGAACLLAATLLSLVKGYTNVPDRVSGGLEWRGASREHLEQVLRIERRSRQWDRSVLDITCLPGAACLLATAGAIGCVAYLLWLHDHEALMRTVVIDAAVLLVPHWVTGVRRILTNDKITIKVRQLLAVLESWEATRREGETMLPQMAVVGDERGEWPRDAKLVLQFDRLRDGFLGLQVQVTINSVQGRDYPYLYCVIVAKPEFKLLEKLTPDLPGSVVAEPKRQDDVDVIVIRRKTTARSGYHTPPAFSRKLFQYALSQTRRLVPST